MISKRDKSIDIAKAIGIILVVLGHAGMPHSSVMFRFHMALFFALSGYCFKDNYLDTSEKLIQFIVKKIKGLYIPFVVFNLGTLFLRNFFIRIGIYTNKMEFLDAPKVGAGNSYGVSNLLPFSEMKPWILNVLKFSGESQLGGATWFLRVLFGISVLWLLINYFIKTLAKFNEHERCIINFAISFLLIAVSYMLIKNGKGLPLQGETVAATYFPYTVGYYIKDYKTKNIYQNIGLATISLGVLVYCDYICNQYGWNSNVNYFDNPFMYIISSTSGIIMIIAFAKMLAEVRYTGFVEYIGQHTLSIIFWHFLCFKIVISVQIYIYNLPKYRLASFPTLYSGGAWWIAYTMIGVLGSVFIAWIYNKMKSMVFFSKLKNGKI